MTKIGTCMLILPVFVTLGVTAQAQDARARETSGGRQHTRRGSNVRAGDLPEIDKRVVALVAAFFEEALRGLVVSLDESREIAAGGSMSP